MALGISQNYIPGIVTKAVRVIVYGDKINQKLNYYKNVEKKFS